MENREENEGMAELLTSKSIMLDLLIDVLEDVRKMSDKDFLGVVTTLKLCSLLYRTGLAGKGGLGRNSTEQVKN